MMQASFYNGTFLKKTIFKTGHLSNSLNLVSHCCHLRYDCDLGNVFHWIHEFSHKHVMHTIQP